MEEVAVQRPDYYMERVSVAQDGVEEPTTVKEALASPQKAEWEEPMAKEMHSLQDDVWELVEPPKDRKIVGSKWVFKVKTNEDGKVERYKARLVAQGFTLVKGADYDETLCPMVRTESLRTLVAMGVQGGDGHDCFGYSDSDWAGDVGDRRSTSGYIFMLSGAGISWRSRKQTSVALSSAEAEYVALSSAVQEAIWLKRLIVELDKEID